MAGSWSAVLAAHNGANFIEEQLRSILDQTVPPAEVLVGDDASTDDTLDVVERVAATHPRGSVIRVSAREQALGVVGNFEGLLGRATTEVVALSDQDDRWHPTRMELLLPRFAAESDLLLLHHDAELIDADGASLGGLFDSLRIGSDALDDERTGRGFERLLRRNLVTGATTVLRRALVDLAVPVPVGWIHDEWLAIVASAHDGLGVDPRRMVDYRQHDGNQIGARRLDLRGVADRFAEDGVERNRRLLTRAESLADAVALMPAVSDQRRASSQEKLVHEQARSALPLRRGQRIGPARREWRTGRYSAFGNGAADLVRDLVQPLRGD